VALLWCWGQIKGAGVAVGQIASRRIFVGNSGASVSGGSILNKGVACC